MVFSWDISPNWQVETDPELTSEVEVRFVSEGPDRTRVELEHRHLDRHGPGWQSVSDGVDGDAGMAALPGPVCRPARGPLRWHRPSPALWRAGPAAQVFAYATDPARFQWQQGVINGHLDQPGPREWAQNA